MKHVTHIIALPRCRTAWLSVALTQPPHSFAFHDGCGDDARREILSPLDYAYKLTGQEAQNVIDCSSGIASLPVHLGMVGGPIIVIEPDDIDRCRDSWIRHMRQPGLIEHWPRILQNFGQCQAGFAGRIALRVPFHDITEQMPAIWAVCCPGVPYDAQRIKELSRLNIQEIH